MKQHVVNTAVTWLLEDMETTTKGHGLTNRQSKYQKANMFKGLMAPSDEALNHPAAPLLLELAKLGRCPEEVGDGWSMAMLEAAIGKGLHPSAMEPQTAGQLRAETVEKVAQGYARATGHVGRNQARPA
jgi:hypothetical protein